MIIVYGIAGFQRCYYRDANINLLFCDAISFAYIKQKWRFAVPKMSND